MGAQLPFRIPPQLLAGQPPDSLQEAALNLSHIDGGIQGLARIVKDIHPQQAAFTKEDGEFLTRNNALEPDRIVAVETGLYQYSAPHIGAA